MPRIMNFSKSAPRLVRQPDCDSRNTRFLIALLAALFIASALFAARLDRFPGDLAISTWIQSLTMPGLSQVSVALSIEESGLFILLSMVLIVAGLYLSKWRKEAFLILGSTLTGAIALEILKPLVARPRPPSDLVLVLQESTSSSFPSGNAGLFALFLIALAFTATSRSGRQRHVVAIWCGTILLLLFIGLSRLYLGAHWFSDVLFAYLFALVWVLAAIEIKKRLEIHFGKKQQ